MYLASLRNVLQCSNSRQNFSFHEFKESATAGRNITYAVFHSELVDRGKRVPTSGDTERR